MKISFNGQFRSLSDFESDELTDFTIITGKNGSGKSQLIELFKILAQKKVEGRAVEENDVKINLDIKRIHTQQLITASIEDISPETYKSQIDEFYIKYTEIKKNEKLSLIFDVLHENGVTAEMILDLKKHDDVDFEGFGKMLAHEQISFSERDLELASSKYGTSTPKPNYYGFLKRILYGVMNDIRTYRVSSFVASYKNKRFINLDHSDFFNSTIPEKYHDSTDLINSKIEKIFYAYLKRRHLNLFQQFLKKEFGELNNSITSEEFNLKHPKPWIIINEIFNKLELEYEFNDITEIDFANDAIIKFNLIKKTIDKVIPFQFLSSGEQVIISLIIKLFTSKYYEKELLYPDLIILDEPDAHLHPAMSKMLIDVLNETFVKKLGIKVILTTHSASTVALAPEDSIFQLSNTPICSLKKISKDAALKILTSGVPSFSVNYENRRQIFVESSNDVLFYEKIYQRLSSYLVPEVSLSFISSGESRTDKYGTKISNCAQVKNITDTLRNTGNKFVWGIIDWDETSISTDYIKVLGNGVRYSIENYLFDPILVAALLLREKIIVRTDLDLTNSVSYVDFKNLSQEQLQFISNFIVNKVESNINPKPTKLNKCKVKLINGIEIDIPIWYLHRQGHTLENDILNTFPSLNALKKNKEEALKLEIIDKVIDDIPELLSIDFIDVFKEVQTV